MVKAKDSLFEKAGSVISQKDNQCDPQLDECKITVSKVCSLKRGDCVQSSILKGSILFSLFILIVMLLNVVYIFVSFAFAGTLGVPIAGVTIASVFDLCRIDISLPLTASWWQYLFVLYVPMFVFCAVLIFLMYINRDSRPRSIVNKRKESGLVGGIRSYFSAVSVWVGTYLAISLLACSILAPVVEWVYQIAFGGGEYYTKLYSLLYISTLVSPAESILLNILLVFFVAILSIVAITYLLFNGRRKK
jgi:hypothetical protein